MAAVLEFRPAAVRRPVTGRQLPAAGDGDCRIIIFPGVRRERRDDAARAAADQRGDKGPANPG